MYNGFIYQVLPENDYLRETEVLGGSQLKRQKFYVTTPIYYPSSDLHIGHAYTTVAADALARFKRLSGYDVMFLTGTDEHGQKIQRRAAEDGRSPQEFVDGMAVRIKSLWQALGISYDDFIRTTEERHKRAVGAVFQRLHDRGDIYKSTYEGWYCTPCESFWVERQLVEGKCPDCARDVELVKEEGYFFRLSRFADRLLKHIEEHPGFIEPASRRNEVVSFIKSGLEDICVSRTTFDWGIPLPFDSRHVAYVWVDALTNYITALGYPDCPEGLWHYWPADLHLVGKEIVRFHAVIWPAILMAVGLELPKKIFGHGWLVLESGKMSKSKGNVIDPLVLIDRYGVDAVRYFLLREIPFGADGFYSEEALINRINSDLANDLGNLVYRTLTMLERFCGGAVPEPGEPEEPDIRLQGVACTAIEGMKAALEKLEISNSLSEIWRLVASCNKYIDERAPWSLSRSPGGEPKLRRVLYNLAESIRICALLLAPFMVETPERIWSQLGLPGTPRDSWADTLKWGLIPPGTRVSRGKPLFPRIEVTRTEAESRGGGDSQPESIGVPESIGIDVFNRIRLKVGKVVQAQGIKGSKKLVRLLVNLGNETKQVVAGIADKYNPDSLVGTQVVVVTNLAPVVIRGVESEGMVLAADAPGGPVLLSPLEEVEPGTTVR